MYLSMFKYIIICIIEWMNLKILKIFLYHFFQKIGRISIGFFKFKYRRIYESIYA